MSVRQTFGYAAGLAVVLATVTDARAVSPADSRPVFSQMLYSVVVDVSPPGLETFSISSSASDADAGDVVTLSIGGQRSFMRFTTTPGNPATFTFSSIGLTYANIGVYDGGFGAFDSASIPNVTSASWRVTIVPEPTAVLLLISTSPIFIRRRHNL